MPVQVVVETHVDAIIKQRAEEIFAAEGLTIDHVLRNVLEKTVEGKCVPMDFLRPNAATLEAMEELRNGGGRRFDTVAELMADLNADD